MIEEHLVRQCHQTQDKQIDGKDDAEQLDDQATLLVQFRRNGEDTEEAEIGLQLDDEVHHNGRRHIAMYNKRISQIKEEDADHRQEEFADAPVRSVVDIEEVEHQRIKSADLVGERQVQRIVKDHTENQRKDGKIVEMSVDVFLYHPVS